MYTISAANVNAGGSGSATQTAAGGGGKPENTSPGSPAQTGSATGGSSGTGWGNKLEIEMVLLVATTLFTFGMLTL